jgi:hypothetical protein
VKVRLVVNLGIVTRSGAYRRVPPQTAVLDDPWVRVNGVWYHRLDGEERASQVPAP